MTKWQCTNVLHNTAENSSDIFPLMQTSDHSKGEHVTTAFPHLPLSICIVPPPEFKG